MYRLIFSFISLFFVFSSYSQQFDLKGVVRDSSGVAISSATVLISTDSFKTTNDFALTDDDGKFKITVLKDQTYFLKVSFLGYHDFLKVWSYSNNESLIITLQDNEQILDGATVKYEMPVMVKGDTLVYKADYFTNGREKKLGDIVKKLPGMEIDERGQVKVEGKPVQKVMIDGKEFFDGDAKMAVENIPADAVDKVEVLKNYNDVEMLKGLGNDEDNVALNIKLKDGKKSFWFGDIDASYGQIERYLFDPTIFFYSPKFSVNILANANNIGKSSFGVQDYFRFSGGFRRAMMQRNNSINQDNSDLGLLLMRNNRAKEMTNLFLAVNFNYNPSKKWSFNGFGIGNRSKIEMEQLSLQKYIETNLEENKRSQTERESELQLYKLSVHHKKSKKFQLNYDLYIKTAQIDQLNITNTQFAQQNWAIDDQLLRSPLKISQNLMSYWNPNSKNIYSFENSYDVFVNQQEYQSNNSGDFVYLPFGLSGIPVKSTQNDLTSNSSNFSGQYNYYRLINNQSNLNLNLSMFLSNQINSIQNTFTNVEGNNQSYDSLLLNSSNELKFRDVSLAAYYKILLFDKLTLRSGASIHSYSNVLKSSSSQRTLFRVLPTFFAKYNFKKSESIQFNYAVRNRFGNINQLNPGMLLQKYNWVFQGNDVLIQNRSEELSLNYFKFSMFDLLDVMAGVHYTKTKRPIKTNVILNGIIQNSSWYNSGIADEFFTSNFHIGKQFGYTKWILDLMYNSMSGPNKVNGIEQLSGSESKTIEFRFNTTFKKYPNVLLSYAYSNNEYSLENSNNRFVSYTPKIELDIPVGAWILVEAEYSHQLYKGIETNISNQIEFANASLYIQKPDSRWEWRLDGINLLNTKSINDDSSSQILVSTSNYLVQGRFIQFGLKYTI